MKKESGKSVNVYSNNPKPEDDIPEDFYSYALIKIQENLSKSEIEILRNIKLNRKVIKKCVMNIPYNLYLTGMGEQLIEHFYKKWEIKKILIKIPAELTRNNEPLFLSSSQYGNMCKIIYIVLTQELPSLKNLTDYFKEIITLLNKLDLPVTWITPSGLKIKYSQIKLKSIKTKTKLISNSRPVTISLPTDNTNKIKMIRSFMPNFIHSLDAANVHILLELLAEIDNIPVYTVHDCFASTPNNMFLLEDKVKKAFIDIYFKDDGYLQKMHNNIIEQIEATTGIIKLDGKVYIDVKPRIEMPDFPQAFKNKDMKEFIKGLLNSKYFIGLLKSFFNYLLF